MARISFNHTDTSDYERGRGGAIFDYDWWIDENGVFCYDFSGEEGDDEMVDEENRKPTKEHAIWMLEGQADDLIAQLADVEKLLGIARKSETEYKCLT